MDNPTGYSAYLLIATHSTDNHILLPLLFLSTCHTPFVFVISNHPSSCRVSSHWAIWDQVGYAGQSKALSILQFAQGIPSTSHLNDSLYHPLGVIPLNNPLVFWCVNQLAAAHTTMGAYDL